LKPFGRYYQHISTYNSTRYSQQGEIYLILSPTFSSPFASYIKARRANFCDTLYDSFSNTSVH